LACSFFVFAAVAVSAVPALARDFVALLYELAGVEDVVYPFSKASKGSLYFLQAIAYKLISCRSLY
jgi:hypothetical protein